LVKSNRAKAQGGSTREGKPFAYLVKRQQHVGPTVSGSEHVPRAEDGGIEMPVLNHLFALDADGDVILPEWGWMGDAEINEMRDAEFGASIDGFAGCHQVNGAQFAGCGRRWIRRANQMDEGVGGTDQLAVTIGVEGISGDHFTGGGELGFLAGADQYANPMVTFEKNRNQAAADITGSARDEDPPGVRRFG
jgi:hypothetical protein